jgi:hypothetical protein
MASQMEPCCLGRRGGGGPAFPRRATHMRSPAKGWRGSCTRREHSRSRAAQEEEAQLLVEAMLEHNALELLVQRLTSLNEAQPDEATAVFNALSTFENMAELKPEVSELVVQKTKVRAPFDTQNRTFGPCLVNTSRIRIPVIVICAPCRDKRRALCSCQTGRLSVRATARPPASPSVHLSEGVHVSSGIVHGHHRNQWDTRGGPVWHAESSMWSPIWQPTIGYTWSYLACTIAHVVPYLAAKHRIHVVLFGMQNRARGPLFGSQA